MKEILRRTVMYPVSFLRRAVFLGVFVGLLLPGQVLTQNKRAVKGKSSKVPLTVREIAKKALEATVLIVSESGNGKATILGSGFFVQPGIIATNYHVVKGASRAYASFNWTSKNKFQIRSIRAVDEENDLALLTLGPSVGTDRYDDIVASAATTLQLAIPSRAEIGDTVYVVGNPEGLEGTFSQGIISAFRGGPKREYIQITAPISHGSSGGPVLDRFGSVIGIAVGYFKDGQNLNFAIPVSKLAALLKPENDLDAGLVPSPKRSSTTPNELTPEWQFVFSGSGRNYYVSRARVSVTPERTLVAWIKQIPDLSPEGRKALAEDVDALNKKNVNRSNALSYSLDQWEFDCARRKMRLLGSANYDERGILIYWEDLSSESRPWLPSLPNSVAEGQLDFVCTSSP